MPIPRVDPVADSLAGSAAKRLGARLGFSSGGQWFMRQIAPRLDPSLMRLTRGRATSLGPWPRSVLLTHTGARSGIERTSPWVYFTDGDRVILVASNYGGTRNPAWYHNIKANPTVTLLGGGFEGRFVGEEVTGEDRDRVWALATKWNPGYAHYQSLAGGRTIPLIALNSID